MRPSKESNRSRHVCKFCKKPNVKYYRGQYFCNINHWREWKKVKEGYNGKGSPA